MIESDSSSRLIMFGPPGSGKGTQAKVLQQMLGVTHIATGEILRDKRFIDKLPEGPLKTEVKRYLAEDINKGLYLADGPMTEIVKAAIERSNFRFILDGFPRTDEQVKSLDEMTYIDKAVLLEISPEEVIDRMKSRMVCAPCHLTYNTSAVQFLPKKPGICDNCEKPLTIRGDEQDEEKIRGRIIKYERETEPIIRAYHDVLVGVNASGKPSQVTRRILNAFGVQYDEQDLENIKGLRIR